MAMATFLHRMMGATALDATTYEEVEADAASGTQALAVVILSAVAAGIGSRGFDVALSAIPVMTAIALFTWAAWALLTYQVGATLLPEATTDVDVNQLLRTLGFAAAPGMFRILGVIPSLSTPTFVLTSLWMLAAMVIAIRQALDYKSTARAVLVSVIGFGLTLISVAVLGMLFSTALE